MEYYPSYLIHFGIKGQKWGNRRYQNEDGTLTTEGKRRYLDDLKGLKNIRNKSREEFRQHASKETYSKYMYNKREYEDLKDTFKMQNTKKDKRQLKFEEEYIKKGMRKEDAEIQAYKRRKTEKILLIAAGIAAAAIAGVAAYKIYENNADRIIKKGTKLQHIVDEDFRGVEDAFVSRKYVDKIKYKGKFGHFLQDKAMFRGTKPNIKDVTIEAKENVKIASRKNARKVLENVYRENPKAIKDFANNHFNENNFRETLETRKLYRKANIDLSKGKITSNVYDAFNANFVGRNKAEDASKLFVSKMNKKGYGAVVDINDKKLSGYNAKDPLILIDRNNKFFVKNIRDVNSDEVRENIHKLYSLENKQYKAKKIIKLGSIGLAALAAAKGSNTIKVRSNNELVAKYQKEHPRTKMTYNEILRDVYKR